MESEESEDSISVDIESGSGGHGSLPRALSLDHLNRELPGFCKQFAILDRRQMVAWWRGGRMRAIFLFAIDLGAIVLGLQDRVVTHTAPWQVMGVLNVHTALALLVAIFVLGLFGSDRPVFWRESANGLNIPAHFLTRVLANWVDLAIFTFSFTALYFVISQPDLNYLDFAWPYLWVTFVASGWGYFVSSIVPPQQGAFIVSLIIFVLCGLLGNPASLPQYMNGGSLEYFVDAVSITRWSVALTFSIFYKISKPIPADNLELQMFCLSKSMFTGGEHPYVRPVVVLLVQGLVLHLLAFLGIRFMNRDKQV